MGMGNRNQVYYDPNRGYYTMGFDNYMGYGKQFINPVSQVSNQPSKTITDMIARANAAAKNVQTPTLASLFQGMSFGQSQTPMLGNQFGGQMGGQFGAGRFLGNNQFGNPAMPMGGFANNTTT